MEALLIKQLDKQLDKISFNGDTLIGINDYIKKTYVYTVNIVNNDITLTNLIEHSFYPEGKSFPNPPQEGGSFISSPDQTYLIIENKDIMPSSDNIYNFSLNYNQITQRKIPNITEPNEMWNITKSVITSSSFNLEKSIYVLDIVWIPHKYNTFYPHSKEAIMNIRLFSVLNNISKQVIKQFCSIQNFNISIDLYFSDKFFMFGDGNTILHIISETNSRLELLSIVDNFDNVVRIVYSPSNWIFSTSVKIVLPTDPDIFAVAIEKTSNEIKYQVKIYTNDETTFDLLVDNTSKILKICMNKSCTDIVVLTETKLYIFEWSPFEFKWNKKFDDISVSEPLDISLSDNGLIALSLVSLGAQFGGETQTGTIKIININKLNVFSRVKINIDNSIIALSQSDSTANDKILAYNIKMTNYDNTTTDLITYTKYNYNKTETIINRIYSSNLSNENKKKLAIVWFAFLKVENNEPIYNINSTNTFFSDFLINNIEYNNDTEDTTNSTDTYTQFVLDTVSYKLYWEKLQYLLDTLLQTDLTNSIDKKPVIDNIYIILGRTTYMYYLEILKERIYNPIAFEDTKKRYEFSDEYDDIVRSIIAEKDNDTYAQYVNFYVFHIYSKLNAYANMLKICELNLPTDYNKLWLYNILKTAIDTTVQEFDTFNANMEAFETVDIIIDLTPDLPPITDNTKNMNKEQFISFTESYMNNGIQFNGFVSKDVNNNVVIKAKFFASKFNDLIKAKQTDLKAGKIILIDKTNRWYLDNISSYIKVKSFGLNQTSFTPDTFLKNQVIHKMLELYLCNINTSMYEIEKWVDIINENNNLTDSIRTFILNQIISNKNASSIENTFGNCAVDYKDRNTYNNNNLYNRILSLSKNKEFYFTQSRYNILKQQSTEKISREFITFNNIIINKENQNRLKLQLKIFECEYVNDISDDIYNMIRSIETYIYNNGENNTFNDVTPNSFNIKHSYVNKILTSYYNPTDFSNFFKQNADDLKKTIEKCTIIVQENNNIYNECQANIDKIIGRAILATLLEIALFALEVTFPHFGPALIVAGAALSGLIHAGIHSDNTVFNNSSKIIGNTLTDIMPSIYDYTESNIPYCTKQETLTDISPEDISYLTTLTNSLIYGNLAIGLTSDFIQHILILQAKKNSMSPVNNNKFNFKTYINNCLEAVNKNGYAFTKRSKWAVIRVGTKVIRFGSKVIRKAAINIKNQLKPKYYGGMEDVNQLLKRTKYIKAFGLCLFCASIALGIWSNVKEAEHYKTIKDICSQNMTAYVKLSSYMSIDKIYYEILFKNFKQPYVYHYNTNIEDDINYLLNSFYETVNFNNQHLNYLDTNKLDDNSVEEEIIYYDIYKLSLEIQQIINLAPFYILINPNLDTIKLWIVTRLTLIIEAINKNNISEISNYVNNLINKTYINYIYENIKINFNIIEILSKENEPCSEQYDNIVTHLTECGIRITLIKSFLKSKIQKRTFSYKNILEQTFDELKEISDKMINTFLTENTFSTPSNTIEFPFNYVSLVENVNSLIDFREKLYDITFSTVSGANEGDDVNIDKNDIKNSVNTFIMGPSGAKYKINTTDSIIDCSPIVVIKGILNKLVITDTIELSASANIEKYINTDSSKVKELYVYNYILSYVETSIELGDYVKNAYNKLYTVNRILNNQATQEEMLYTLETINNESDDYETKVIIQSIINNSTVDLKEEYVSNTYLKPITSMIITPIGKYGELNSINVGVNGNRNIISLKGIQLYDNYIKLELYSNTLINSSYSYSLEILKNRKTIYTANIVIEYDVIVSTTTTATTTTITKYVPLSIFLLPNEYDIFITRTQIVNSIEQCIYSNKVVIDKSSLYIPDFNLTYSNISSSNEMKTTIFSSFINNQSLRGLDLSEINLTNADLRYTDLTNSKLYRTNLTNADLRYANLTNADLRYANLTNADLRYANLTNADLANAIL